MHREQYKTPLEIFMYCYGQKKKITSQRKSVFGIDFLVLPHLCFVINGVSALEYHIEIKDVGSG